MFMSTWHGRRSRIWSEGCMCLCAMFKRWACLLGMAFWGWSEHVPTRYVEKMNLPRWNGLCCILFVWKAPSLDWAAFDCILGEDQHCIYSIYAYTSSPGSSPCVKLRLIILMEVTFRKGWFLCCASCCLPIDSNREAVGSTCTCLYSGDVWSTLYMSYIDAIICFVTCVKLTGFAEYCICQVWPKRNKWTHVGSTFGYLFVGLWIVSLQTPRLPHIHSVS